MKDIKRFTIGPEKKSEILKKWISHGLDCLALQGPFGINGYVGIPENHPDYKKDYDDVEVDVHGGLTFADEGDDKLWKKGLWWFGFDTAHAFSGLWSLESVIMETERLAKQLAERQGDVGSE